jgi:hypothetical protein
VLVGGDGNREKRLDRIFERSFNPRAACLGEGDFVVALGLVQTWLSLYRDPERSELRGGFRKLAIYREILVI